MEYELESRKNGMEVKRKIFGRLILTLEGLIQTSVDAETTMTEWRYMKAEQEKDQGNAAFRKGDYHTAVKLYEAAHNIESELPHYQLNLAAAHLKLNNWIEAEKACSKALQQHRSSKGLYRRARARRMLGRSEEAIQDLRAVLRLQPSNREALAELASLIPLASSNGPSIDISSGVNDDSKPSTSKQQPSESSPSLSTKVLDMDPKSLQRLGIPKPKPIKQPSFARTKGDDRRLKIVLMGGVDSVRIRGNFQVNGKENMFTISRHGKEKAGALKSQRTKEMERMKADCLVYPSWDRYEVKRADY